MKNPPAAGIKKYLLLLPLLLLVSSRMYGQSVKFSDLVYFTKLNNMEVYNSLLGGTAFRQAYTTNVDGQELSYFKNIVNKPNSEKIIIGSFAKLSDGTLLRTVNYTSTDPKNIVNMLTQAKSYGLQLQFEGEDASNYIYLLDNDSYHVGIYLRRDKTSGMVEIKQKEFMGTE